LTAGDKKSRTRAVIRKLKARFPDAGCSLNHSNALQLLVSTILSAQCTDKRVNIVTKELFKRYKTAQDFAEADPQELEELIRSTGFYRNKTRSILGMAQALVEQHGGEVPRTMDELNALAGVGRKTANVVLGNAFGIDDGVVVDTHVKRLSNRLKLTSKQDPVKIERDLMDVVPKKEWTLFPHLMIEHGRETCRARKPKCEECPITTLCPSSAV
jgi:endonuclease-3